MKVITIKQPFASLIAAGLKEYEFRTWKTAYRGELLIHAGKSVDAEAMKKFEQLDLSYPLGCIIAKATLTDCVKVDEDLKQDLRKKTYWCIPGPRKIRIGRDMAFSLRIFRRWNRYVSTESWAFGIIILRSCLPSWRQIMRNQIPFLRNENIVSVTPLLKGWSKDKKYILEDKNGCKFLLRISDSSLWEKKKAQFALLEKIEKLGLSCSRPIALGTTEEGSVYTVLSYLEGTDGLEAVSQLGNGEAYRLGIEAGEVLRRLHEIEIPAQELSWWERYQKKMPGKIEALRKCQYRLPMQEEMLRYYEEHCFLMKNRPLSFTHGDFHLGNMIVKDGKIGIIDFDKNGVADPYDEFKPFCWNVMCSEYFETGLINGYFQNQIPEDFFPILKFYTAESLISHLPWSVTFGEAEIQTAQKVAANQMIWYDHFQLEIPSWYHGLLL